MVDSRTHFPTIVIGAGQAGLATGYHLAERGEDFVILNAEARVGDEWRRRWDSLLLFTPARHSALPGLPHPDPRAFLSKDEIADYLEGYAKQFDLPVRHGVTVTGVARSGEGFTVTTSAGVLTADSVVVATGATTAPAVPGFASELDADIRQLHSSEYRNPNSVPPGTVLVVGAGTSGAEIALELAASHPVLLAGRPTPHIPDAVFAVAGELYWNLVYRVLTIDTPIGRKVAPKFHSRGAPLIRISMKKVQAAGVSRLPRLTGVENGMPIVEGVSVPRPSTVIWATGYRPGLEWIEGVPLDAGGLPDAPRGVVASMPGLFFVGMPFQFGLTSQLLGGVGRDAGYVAERIAERQRVNARVGESASGLLKK
ncbi:MAG TPA: NAD(P)/FAD-dependent oxidoreductase [Terrimesophilobacter sp.]|nr:NAD(P)/FAD-dependent oxidoreductase [Terrimesophilobacter sp.]